MIKALVVLSCLTLGQGAADPETDLSDEVARLVVELNDVALSQREASEQRLLDMGPAALEFLPEPDDTLPAETQLRLERVIQKLRRQQISLLTEPSLVSLNESTMSVTEAFAELEKQTGNKIIDYREEFNQPVNEIDVDVDFDGVSFWQALDTVLDQSGLTVYSYGGESGLTIVVNNSALDRSGLADYRGAFRFEPVEIRAQRNLREAGESVLHLKLEVEWEPRLHPIVVRHDLSDVKATDGEGNPIAVAEVNSSQELAVNRRLHFQEFEIPLESPPRDVAEIGEISGHVEFLLTGPRETFRFDELAEGRKIEQRRGDATVILERIRKNRDTWEIRAVVHFEDSADALQSHFGWVYNNPALLEDADGETILPATIETTRRTENEVGMAYLFDVPQGLDGMTFVYKTPVAAIKQRVDYELHDLKLP